MDVFQFGKSKTMMEIKERLSTISNSDLPVLITGETGTGKTLLAREIHNLSKWSQGLFLYLDCATIPLSLVESELFGHEKGAFTGATERKGGLFELACGGTVFLDEIENLDLSIQAKLLRVLEEKKFRRVGGTDEMEVHFRLISASNSHIEQRIKQGAFRQDLFYRLKGTRLLLPPLRERKEHILELASHFLKLYNQKNNINRRFSNELKPYLRNNPWPGNVRELKFATEEAAVRGKNDEIFLEDFALDHQLELLVADGEANHLSLTELEKKYITVVLKSVEFNKTRAAKIMGIGLNTLYRKLDKYGINQNDEKQSKFTL